MPTQPRQTQNTSDTKRGQFASPVPTPPEIAIAVTAVGTFDSAGLDAHGFTFFGVHENGTVWGDNGFDVYGYDRATGAEHNMFGFDRDSVHETTGTVYDADGWSEAGRNAAGEVRR